MRLMRMTDYAMRLLMYVAHNPGRLCTIREIAEAYGISNAHLTKITHRLGLAGILDTVRGRGGGMRLSAAPADISLGAVVVAIEPDFALVECFATGRSCVLTGRCHLNGILAGALEAFLAHLGRYSLADLIQEHWAPAGTRRRRRLMAAP